MVTTDICIIGAGPVGLFAVFEAGLLKMRCHVVDAIPQLGGQLTELYPQKPIYDIPGYPSILAKDLILNLEKQIAPFKPTFTLGERVESLTLADGGKFLLETTEKTRIECKAVAIAAGLGSFEPRRPDIEKREAYEKKGIDYMVRNPRKYTGKKVVIAGGGDSALDWVLYLADIAQELTLVHRREGFRAAPDSVEKMNALKEQGKIKLILNATLSAFEGKGHLSAVTVVDKAQKTTRIPCDFLLPLFGLTPKLGPIADWGLNLDKRSVEVDPLTFLTNIPGVYAIGDICSYPGKLKLILCGFHEAAMMAHNAHAYLHPEKKTNVKHTSVSGIEGF